MQRWEYKTESLEIKDGNIIKLQAVLDAYGKKGWELVQIDRLINTNTHFAIFKRTTLVIE